MFKYRPQRGTLEDSMKEAKEFITMDQMFDYIVKSDPLHLLQKEDLSISEDLGKDDRIDWAETRNVLTKRYGKDVYDTPQAIGWCSMEGFYNSSYESKAKNIYIGGISRHHLLKMLYDAAKPYDKTISIEEAVDALHSTLDVVTQLRGKRLYVNVFGNEFDGTEYDKINGIGLSYNIVTYMRYHLLCGKHPWELGIPNFDGDLLDVLDKVSKANAKVEADQKSELELFKARIITTMESELDKLSEYISKNKDGSTLTIPVQNVYKVTCYVGLDVNFILIRATSEIDAWNTFWKHLKDEPTLDHEKFGSKEDYEYTRGYWKKRSGNVSIDIEPIKATSDFVYIGRGRNV